jgi:4-diphosphocytidyl-2-C-methyl-D-erythritol kinase
MGLALTASITLRTPAKINPVLEVLGKRADGYHELALVFQAVGLYDELEFFEDGQGLHLDILESPVPLAADDSNLILKAAKLFFGEILKEERGVRIRLKKKIPLAAGLGGGSSDAAATLVGLDRLFKTQAGEKKLGVLAAQLGSDVPFFLTGGTALGRGRGELITAWPAGPEISLILVKPPEGLSTPAVYRSGKAVMTGGEKAQHFQAILQRSDLREIGRSLFNGLEPAAFSLMPEVERIKQKLLDLGALGALVSGSGPTVFGIAENLSTAQKIGQSLEGKGYSVFVVSTVPGGAH